MCFCLNHTDKLKALALSETMRPLIGYVRVSASKQGKSGLGIEARQEALSRPLLPRDVAYAPNNGSRRGHGRRRSVPQNRREQVEQKSAYSITSSAATSRAWGIVRLSAFAVFKLITNSNLVGCCTGSPPGFAPLSIRST